MRRCALKSFLRKRSVSGLLGLCMLFVGGLCAPVAALSNATGPNGSNVQALHALGYTGQNVNIGLISVGHAQVSHEAFEGAAAWYDATGQGEYDPINHDTSMAGIMISRGGTAYPEAVGLAPEAGLLSVKVLDGYLDFTWLQNALEEIKNHGCRVVATGFQLDANPDGSTVWARIYDYYAYEHNMVFTTAAGNNSQSITVFGDTYNSITTAGLIRPGSDFYYQVGISSNPGPTVDGRKKPEVAAPSQNQWVPRSGSDTHWNHLCCGDDDKGFTSWAVPHTAGVAAVLLSYADTTDEPDDGRSEVIKAVMVNSTFPNILAQNGAWTDPANQTWHPDRGYGRLDAFRAWQTLSADQISPNQTTTAPKGWVYRSFSDSGLTDSYWIQAEANARLLTTITWHRAVERKTTGPPHSPQVTYEAESSPRLSLEMRIFDPDGVEIFADTGGGDNLRKADVLLETAGFYELRITNTTDKADRTYALAFEVLEPLAGDLNNDYVVNLSDLLMLLDCWPQPHTCDLSAFKTLASGWLTADRRYAAP